jgi:prepilin-type N-terminal cleavage/methylation domain-containing protein
MRRSSRRTRFGHRHRLPLGLTLIELLVVVVILLVLTSVTIPLAMTGNEGRRTREAARLVSGFLSSARNRAIETGRPMGVQFERLKSNGNASMLLSYAEVPPPYAGDTVLSGMNISANGRITQFFTNDTGWLGLIRKGDLIRINHQGCIYQLFCDEPFVDVNGNGVYDTDIDGNVGTTDPEPYIDSTGDGSWTASTPPVDADGYFQLPAPHPTTAPNVVWAIARLENGNLYPPSPAIARTNVPFQIIRQPIKTSGTPLQLPDGAVVDLTWSGEGSIGTIYSNTASPFITFSPNGIIDYVYRFDNLATSPVYRRPVGPIHFLIGSPVKAITGGETTATNNVVFNYQDQNNMWVSVGHQTGLVSTTEVALWRDRNSDGVRDIFPIGHANQSQNEVVRFGTTLGWANEDGANSRGIAQTFQSMGGR